MRGRYLAIAAALAVGLMTMSGPVGARAGEDPAKLARMLTEATGVRAGLCVCVGKSDGRLEAALGAGPDILVQSLCSEPKLLDAARKHVYEKGLYGRVSVLGAGLKELPYSERLVNLLVIRQAAVAIKAGLSAEEIVRVLAPGGWLAIGGGGGAELSAKLLACGMKSAKPGKAGSLLIFTKPRPAGMAEWGHPNCDAGGGRVSAEPMKPPNRLRWTAGLSYSTGGDIASGYEALRSAGGRNFYLLNPTQILLPPGVKSRHVIVARDAFNGLPLWKRRSNVATPSTFVAVGDRVYTVEGGSVVALDAASGKTVTTYLRFGTSGLPRQLLVHKGVLLMVWPDKLRAVDPASGKLKWKHDLEKGTYFTENFYYRVYNSVYAEGDSVFFAVSGAPYWWGGPGKKPAASLEVALHGLKFADGSPLWKTDISERMRRGAANVSEMRRNKFLFARKGLLIFELCTKKRSSITVCAYSAVNGKFLWEHKASCAAVRGYTAPPGTLYAGGLVWMSVPWTTEGQRPVMNRNEMLGLDPKTGKVARRFKMDEVLGCWRDLGTDAHFIAGRPPDFISWKDGEVTPFDGVRSSCKVGAIIANGMYYTVPNKCRCINDQIRGFVGFGHTSPQKPEHPLVKGPAFGVAGKPVSGAAGGGDWRAFRADAARSGGVSSALSRQLEPLWSTQVLKQNVPGKQLEYEWDVDPMGGSALTQPVIAGETVYVGDVNSHRVMALERKSGAVKWCYTAGGRLDTPPTIHGNLCLFGCRDGWAYCLRASDGELVWRLRGAPEERRIIAFGGLESLWPVYGGVLVEKNKVCFAAGRSSATGGIRVFAADPASGRIMWRKTLDVKREPGKPKKLKVPSECSGDALVSSGGELILASNVLWRMKLDTGEDSVTHPSKPKPRILYSRRGSFLLDRSWQWFGAGAYINGSLRYGNLGCEGQLAAFDATKAYFAVRTCYWPTRGNKGTFDSVIKAVDIAKNKGLPSKKVASDWQVTVPHPTQFRAMILAGDVVCAGGPTDIRDPRKGAIWVLSAKDGKVLKKLELASPPVSEGLAAAGGRLYVSSADGKVTCYGKK